jgi:hypothetical protein
MNEERFRELARQAGVLIDWGEDIKVGRWGIGGNYKNMQKFAELIVRECVDRVTSKANGWGDMTGFAIKESILDCAKDLKEHFGVEE